MKTSERSFFAVLTALALAASMLVNMTGCGIRVSAADLMEGITPSGDHRPGKISSSDSAAATDFGVKLLKAAAEKGENTLVSPISVIAALAMTMNGAKGQTLSEMEAVLGMTSEELNKFYRDYAAAMPQGVKCRVDLANSLWFRSDGTFTADRDFLQTNADYFGASIYAAPFDGTTLRDVNAWVKGKTKGMIPEILDDINPLSVMYLINALAFEAEWAVIYQETAVSQGKFTLENGSKRTVDFMNSHEHNYLDGGNASGFIKYYAGQKCAFAALLPDEGVSLDEYVASLSGEKLAGILANASSEQVIVSMPKFETEYGVELSGALRSLGMTAAFDMDSADFSGIGKSAFGNIYIGEVIHKTFISVNEKGTRAGAATLIDMRAGAAAPTEEPKRVILDRPFVYMLIDCENNLPFFIGTMYDVGK
ncbi:MAG: serpin family protein [Clostridia bacterium]|nr:serpin family protein [Clostridia bacterium]